MSELFGLNPRERVSFLTKLSCHIVAVSRTPITNGRERGDKIFDKTLLKKIEEIENLSAEDKTKVYELIDMALGYHKTKQAFSK